MTTGNETTSSATSGKRVLIIGATSSLAEAICHTLAREGHSLILAARDEDEVTLLANDLTTRYATSCTILVTDFLDADFTTELLMERAGEFDHIIIATGMMGSSDPMSLANIAYTIHINYTLPAQIATLAAQRLSAKKDGCVVIISSVAGDRGRQSNFAYGSAKAALSTFASGLRNYFCKKGVHIMTVKPGFIDTPMTWGMQSPLIASRDYVADKIVAAMHKRKNIVYVPFFWRYIMLIITHIPEMIFKRLSM